MEIGEKKNRNIFRTEEIMVLNNIYYLKYNKELQNFHDKKRFPWHLKIVIEAKLFFSDPFKKELELELQKKIYEKLKRVLGKYCRIVEVAKIEKPDSIELHWYLCSVYIDYLKVKKVVDKIKLKRNIKFFLSKDQKWDNVQFFLKVHPK